MANKVLLRSKLDKKFTWNAESVFPSAEAWETELRQIIEDSAKIKQFQGRLGVGTSSLFEALNEYKDLVSRAQICVMYALFSYSVDTTDQRASAMRAKAQGMYGQVLSAVAFYSRRSYRSERANSIPG